MIRRGRFLAMKRASLHIEEVPSLFANNVIYSPLHSERGRGRGCRGDVVRLVVQSYQPPSALLKTKEGMSHDIPSLLFLAILSIRASCRIRTNDPEITNHVLWPTELKRQVDKRFLSHRYNLLPLLCSQPGGFERSWS